MACSSLNGIRTQRGNFTMKGKYFEELNVGEKFISPGRTVTEADIVFFAGLSGDYTLLHTNEEWCKTTFFKKRIAHGLLVASIASGLVSRMCLLEGTGLAHLGTTMKFTAPVYAGDTLNVELQIVEKKEVDETKGRFRAKMNVVNQDGEIVEKEDMNIMVARKPGN